MKEYPDGTAIEENPLLILQAIRASAERGGPLDRETMETISERGELLKWESADKIRLEFEGILTAKFAGCGLKALIDAKLLPYITGALAFTTPKRAMAQMDILAENIDKTLPIRERRLGLFYLCYGKKKAFEAIEFLRYDEKTRALLHDAMRYLLNMSFLKTKEDLKRFAGRRGRESYEYLEGLAKAHRIVYGLPESAILDRHHMMRRIKDAGEPVYIEDLNLTEDDLLDNEIAAGEQADKILESLLLLVHEQPRLNSKKALLFYAKKFEKNPLIPIYGKVKRRMRFR